jgi:6-phosphogluconolactonase
MAVTERFFPTFDQMASALASEVASRLAHGVAQRGTAGLTVTGGGTPAPIYKVLATLDAPWANVEITLSDERWVDIGDPASNEGMVRKSLLQGRAAAARLVGLKTADATPGVAEPAVNRAIEAMARPFEATLLGMGDDGHVASLFPNAPELVRALDDQNPAFVCSVDRADAAGASERLSMTRRALLDTCWIAVVIKGEEKREIYRRAMAGDDIAEMPVRMALRQHLVPVEVWWGP